MLGLKTHNWEIKQSRVIHYQEYDNRTKKQNIHHTAWKDEYTRLRDAIIIKTRNIRRNKVKYD